MSEAISREGMEPEWVAREVDKSNKMLRAWMLEEQGDVDTALNLYAQVADLAEPARARAPDEAPWIGCGIRHGKPHKTDRLIARDPRSLDADGPQFLIKRTPDCIAAHRAAAQYQPWRLLLPAVSPEYVTGLARRLRRSVDKPPSLGMGDKSLQAISGSAEIVL
jgi:hypothetical protein